MHTALSERIGFLGSRKSHRCVKVSIEQLANRCGCFMCQSIVAVLQFLDYYLCYQSHRPFTKLPMSVITRVCALSECINVGWPERHVITSINWLVWWFEIKEMDQSTISMANHVKNYTYSQGAILLTVLANSPFSRWNFMFRIAIKFP